MADTASKQEQEQALGSAGRILLVDDQPELRRLVRRGLMRSGYVVVEAWNGHVAVELAQQLRFDVVISDVCMPDLSGVELLEALRELDPDLPVVLTSGAPEALRSLDAFACLEKPVSFEAIRDTAASAIELRRARSQGRDGSDPRESSERLRIPDADEER